MSIAKTTRPHLLTREAAAARIEALEAQLPAEMQDCTIRFMECEKGHGRLTATNWVQQGCHYCRIEALEAALRPYATDFCEGWCKDSSPNAMFDDCSGCRARAALALEQDK